MTNKIVFVIIGQIHKNITLTSIMFDYYGTDTKQCIIEADTWEEGYIRATRTGSTHAVFVSSGTVFTDVIKFLEKLNKYPHYGLVGHIVDPKNDNAYIWIYLYSMLKIFQFETLCQLSQFGVRITYTMTIHQFGCDRPVVLDNIAAINLVND